MNSPEQGTYHPVMNSHEQGVSCRYEESSTGSTLRSTYGVCKLNAVYNHPVIVSKLIHR